ncbi:hypothetical protein JR316_0011107 [Psilocybe cubensis]|uniref:Uncharacterized protein n=1 Tax=Psilocybe cubensis TaxID=181762 RepID=A0ACB8GNG3_PSICU|nr:hypothetical protein JR316_0011107 [Psilocybe cubensis]KAH9477188.1 hypothetical protein JR316_0011107 [Psilocybe cubensis]
MLKAFKIKEFDLEPIYAQWTDGPVFTGNPKKDMPVEEWLEKIKEGCIARGVPEEYWYKVAQHFMGPKAKARLDELKQVIVKVNGGKYRWTWKKFKIAVVNLGWSIDKDAKETIKVQQKGTSLWFFKKKDTTAVEAPSEAEEGPECPTRSTSSTSSNSTWFSKKTIVEEPEEIETPGVAAAAQPKLSRAATFTGFWPTRMNTKDEKELPARPPNTPNTKAKSDTMIVASKGGSKQDAVAPRSQTDGGEATTQVPVWLLNACNALEFITSEHPKAMSIISAILITAGSIPTIPAIAAGAGGAVLASGAAHAIGAIAVGVGQALNAGVQHGQKKQEGQGAGSSH